MRIETDFLVVGTGVAGLTFALKAAESGRVLVITKSKPEESNSWYAQGGIAGVFAAGDSFEEHVQDTLRAGAGLCNERVVRRVVMEGPERIRELMAYGVHFDRQPNGELMLGREGGHSQHRILHSKDATGRAISSVLLEQVQKHPNITLTDQLFAVDLLTQHHLGLYVNRGNPDITCYGVYALNYAERQVYTILARCTVLASGGCGCVYATTTNPSVATGDGIAMVLRAKGRIANMEFIQFHPTAFYGSDKQPAFLITEALRGKGALLLDPLKLDRFMPRYDSRAELAPRDIVARAIDQELKLSGLPHVWLDSSHLPADEIKEEFPTIYEYCLAKGYDITKEPIPVLPAAHYLCGGIEVDEWGRTSINRLYAIGECSSTGLHGANRLASNSLLEALVYGHAAAEHARKVASSFDFEYRVPDWNARDTDNTDEWVLISHNLREVQSVMSDYVGIVRSDLRLDRAARRIDLIYRETESFYQRTRISPSLCELRNLIACAYLIIKCAKIRKESRGLHTTLDYPDLLPVAYPTRV